MSGVIMEDGTQYERCGVCGKHVLFVGTPAFGEATLTYEPPSERHKYGLDICTACVPLSQEQRDDVLAARVERFRAEQIRSAEEHGWDVVINDEGRVEVVGPFKVGDQVVVRGLETYVTSIRFDSDEIWCRNPDIPSGVTGAAFRVPRDAVALI